MSPQMFRRDLNKISPTLKTLELSHMSALNFRSDRNNFTKCAPSQMPQYELKHFYHICINNQISQCIIKTES